jgi:hypothetical protein
LLNSASNFVSAYSARSAGFGLVHRLERGGRLFGRAPQERQLGRFGQWESAGRVALDAEGDVHRAGGDVLVLSRGGAERAARVNGDAQSASAALLDVRGPRREQLSMEFVRRRHEVTQDQLYWLRGTGLGSHHWKRP